MTILRFSRNNGGAYLKSLSDQTTGSITSISPSTSRIVDVDVAGTTAEEQEVIEAMVSFGWSHDSTDPAMSIAEATIGTVPGFASPGQTQPGLTSSGTASDTEGDGISYVATSGAPDVRWIVVDDDGSGVSIDYASGVMSGGVGALPDVYDITLRAANVFGCSVSLSLEWTVTAAAADGVTSASINSGGVFVGDGQFPAIQSSTSGSGIGAAFTVTVTGSTVVSIDSIDLPGTGYSASDTITIAVIGPSEILAAVLDVDAIG